MSTFKFVRHPDPQLALGCAVDLLRLSPPFDGFPFGKLANVLMGEIRRRHYFFTFEGERLVGFAGWALCSFATAEAWVRGERYPDYEECLQGDSWVGVTFYASDARVCFAQAAQLRHMFPDKHVFFKRDYGHRVRAVAIARPQRVKRSLLGG